jgi:hypothetical protein
MLEYKEHEFFQEVFRRKQSAHYFQANGGLIVA